MQLLQLQVQATLCCTSSVTKLKNISLSLFSDNKNVDFIYLVTTTVTLGAQLLPLWPPGLRPCFNVNLNVLEILLQLT